MTGAFIITLLYIAVVVGITIFVLVLLNRLVSAHERIADAMAHKASKFKEGGNP